MFNLQSSQHQNKSKIDFYNHLQMILAEHSDHLTENQKNSGGHEDRQGGAKEWSTKTDLNNNASSFLGSNRTYSNFLHNMLG